MPVYLKEPEPRIWHEEDFRVTHFAECKRNVYEYVYSFFWGCFVYRDRSHHPAAYLPEGWAATEIKVAESRFNGSYWPTNTWGYAAYVGPKDLIEELAALEKQRIAAEQAVLELLRPIQNRLGGIERPESEQHNDRYSLNTPTYYRGEVAIPNQYQSFEPILTGTG